MAKGLEVDGRQQIIQSETERFENRNAELISETMSSLKNKSGPYDGIEDFSQEVRPEQIFSIVDSAHSVDNTQEINNLEETSASFLSSLGIDSKNTKFDSHVDTKASSNLDESELLEARSSFLQTNSSSVSVKFDSDFNDEFIQSLVVRNFKRLQAEHHPLVKDMSLEDALYDHRLRSSILSPDITEFIRINYSETEKEYRDGDDWRIVRDDHQTRAFSTDKKNYDQLLDTEKKNYTKLRSYYEGEEHLEKKYYDYESDPSVMSSKKAIEMLHKHEKRKAMLEGIPMKVVEEDKKRTEFEQRFFNDHLPNKSDFPDEVYEPLLTRKPEDIDLEHFIKWARQKSPQIGVIKAEWQTFIDEQRHAENLDKHPDDEKVNNDEATHPDVFDDNEAQDAHLEYDWSQEMLMDEEDFIGKNVAWKEQQIEDSMFGTKEINIGSPRQIGEGSPIPVNLGYQYDMSHFKAQHLTGYEAIASLNMKKFQQNLLDMQGRFFWKKNPFIKAKIPSLWAYYNTLPTWARHSPHIRNIFVAMEYSKPTMSMKNKEFALKYACSLLVPLDAGIESMLVMLLESKPIRLNAALGKEMEADLEFKELDIWEVGRDEDDEPEIPREVIESKLRRSKESQRGARAEIATGDQLHRVLKKIESEQQKLDEVGQEFVQEEDQVLQDFLIKPYPDHYTSTTQYDQHIPQDFYDNDDGFWDDFISEKYQGYQEQGFLSGRKFFKH